MNQCNHLPVIGLNNESGVFFNQSIASTMKTLIFISLMLLLSCINAQILRVKVYESIQYYKIDTVGLLSAISNAVEPVVIKSSDCEYVMDLTKSTGLFFRNGVLELEFNISFVNIGKLFFIKCFIEDYDLGVIVNTDIENETFDWWSKSEDLYEISKATNFEIVKSQ
jgi:hypothetical protein